MSVNVNTNYTEMSKSAQSMRTDGKAINNSLVFVYNELNGMYDAEEWRGERYNNLILDFKKIDPSLKQIIKIVVQSVPDALETVANNYSKFDTGSAVGKLVSESITQLPALTVGPKAPMKFNEVRISERGKKMYNELEKIIDKLDSIDTTFGKIQWQSAAADAFRPKFKSLKNNTKSTLESIKKQFKQVIDEATEQMRRTEKANTITQ